MHGGLAWISPWKANVGNANVTNIKCPVWISMVGLHYLHLTFWSSRKYDLN